MLARLTASLTLPMHALLVQLILFPTPVLLPAYLAHMEHQPMVEWEKHVALQVLQTSKTTHVVQVLLPLLLLRYLISSNRAALVLRTME